MPGILDEAKRLRSLWGGFWASRAILTANNYRVFDHLKSSKTADDIAKILKTDVRATEIFLDSLTGLGLLKKTSAGYRNAGIANRLLVSGSPHYQGDIIRHADSLWKNWSGLDDVVRTGLPNHKSHNQDAFIRGMHNLSVFKARKVVRAIGLKGVRKALDLGGGPGTYAIEMARKGVSVTLFDRPETVSIAADTINKSGVGNIKLIKGDFHHDGIGKGYDLILISQVLHSCSAEENMRIIEKSRQALNTGGKVVVHEFYLDENRAAPVQSALFSVNMLVNTENGRCFSPSEIKGWFYSAGFKNIMEKMLDDSALVFGKNVP